MCRTDATNILANRTETYEKKDPRVAFRHRCHCSESATFLKSLVQPSVMQSHCAVARKSKTLQPDL